MSRAERFGRRSGGGPGGGDRLDAVFALAGVAALVVVGPLRGLLEDYPLLLYLAALALFLAPGAMVCRCYLRDRLPGVAGVPVAFVISASVFALLGVPLLMAHSTLAVYLALAGAVVGAAVAVAGMRARTWWREGGGGSGRQGLPDALWVPFLILCAALAYVAWTKTPQMYDDIWIYLSNVRDFTSTDRLALYEPYLGRETGVSRVRINGWLLLQAALVQVSGIDVIELVLRYLAPTLVVVALLAVYALARTLLEGERAALFVASIYALFMLVNLSDSLLTFGGEFVGRLAEDKFAARYIFLPVALAVAALFAKHGGMGHLLLFGLICWAMMAIHPVGLAITGLAMAGFALVYLAANARTRSAWTRSTGLGLAGLSAIAVPAALAYLLTGEPLTAVLKEADINSGDPDVLANMVFVKPERQRIFELGPDSYIMHPSLLLDPVVLGALLLGVPFLARRVRTSLAAQMLLGVLSVVTIVCYVPMVATFMGDSVVVPGQLWRLAWPLPLAAVLTAGWMGWEALRRALHPLRRLGIPGSSHLLPAALVMAAGTLIAPAALAGAETVDRSEDLEQSPLSCFDPVYGWLESNLDEPSVVLAPDAENTCIPAYSAQANVLGVRGALVLGPLPKLIERVPGEIEFPQGVLDVRRFFGKPTRLETVEILDRYGVDYILLRKGSARNTYLSASRGFIPIETPSQRYALYKVDRAALPPPSASS